MLVGFSALSLITVLVVIELISPWMSHPLKVVASLSTTLWFALNLILSGRFLYITFKFIDAYNRMSLVTSHVINEVIIDEIKRRLKANLVNSATSERLSLLTQPSNKSLNVVTFTMSDLPERIVIHHDRPKVLNNVWYRPLRLVISCLAQINKANNNEPTIRFPVIVLDRATKESTICESNFRLGRFSKYCITACFRFKNLPKSPSSLNLKNVTEALFSQLEDALKENSPKLFEEAMGNLETFQREIESSLCFINDDGEPDNWMLLSDSGFFGKNYLHNFIPQSLVITKRTVRRVVEDSSYFEDWCYFFPKIFAPEIKVRPIEVGRAYLHGHALIWNNLMTWLISAAKDKQIRSSELNRAITGFVSSWESWGTLLKDVQEESHVTYLSLVENHLSETSIFIVTAHNSRNLEAIHWATDMLLHWHEIYSDKALSYDSVLWNSHHQAVTNNIFNVEPESNIFKAIFKDQKPSRDLIESITIRNRWIDTRCLLIGFLIDNVVSWGDEEKTLIKSLLDGKTPESDNLYDDPEHSLSSHSEIISVYLRQMDFWQKGYETSWAEKQLQRFVDCSQPRMISGRIYSLNAQDINHVMTKFTQIIGIGLAYGDSKISQAWLDFFLDPKTAYEHRERVINNLRSMATIDSKIIDITKEIFDLEPGQVQDHLRRFIDTITEFCQQLNDASQKQVMDAFIDQNRLDEMIYAASSCLESMEEAPLPLKLFKTLDFVDDGTEDSVLNITNYKKVDIADGIISVPAGNETTWLQNLTYSRIASSIYNQLYKNTSWTNRSLRGDVTDFHMIVSDAKSLLGDDHSPLFLVSDSILLRRLHSAVLSNQNNQAEIPFSVERRKNINSDTYICHLEDIEVHKFTHGFSNVSLLIPIESFHTIKIKEYAPSQYVKITFEAEEKAMEGTLKLEVSIGCDFEPQKGFSYKNSQ
jgi:hypothetical protein